MYRSCIYFYGIEKLFPVHLISAPVILYRVAKNASIAEMRILRWIMDVRVY